MKKFVWWKFFAVLLLGLIVVAWITPKLEAKRDFLHQWDPEPELNPETGWENETQRSPSIDLMPTSTPPKTVKPSAQQLGLFKIYCPPPIYVWAKKYEDGVYVVRYYNGKVTRRYKVSSMQSWHVDWVKEASSEVMCWTGTGWKRYGGSFDKEKLDAIAIWKSEEPQAQGRETLYRWKLPAGITVEKATKWVPAGSNTYEVWIRVKINGEVVAEGPNTRTVDWKNGGNAVSMMEQFYMTGGGIGVASLVDIKLMGLSVPLLVFVLLAAVLAGWRT